MQNVVCAFVINVDTFVLVALASALVVEVCSLPAWWYSYHFEPPTATLCSTIRVSDLLC